MKLNNLIKQLLNDLPERQRDIVVGRYGLAGKPALTLAELGENYGITRERVRQIESLALSTIRPKLRQSEASKLINSAVASLKKYGGIRRADYLLGDLNLSEQDIPHINFLLDASKECHFYKEDKDFYSFWFLAAENKKQAGAFIDRLKNFLKNKKTEVIEHNKFDELFVESIKPHEFQDAVAMNYVSISKAFNYNAFGDFGLTEWPEILPKNSRDWAYLILKKHRQPLHFTEIAEKIRSLKPDEKQTNTQTVHNELIKDERFVLVGRGTYGLSEFGLLPGTAKEVIAHFLKTHGPLKAKELIEKVSTQRIFKENTLLLNLQNKKHFERLGDGRYRLREA